MKGEELIGQVYRCASPSVHEGPEPLRLASVFRMKKAIIAVAVCASFGALNLAAQGERVFKGKVCLGPEGRTPITENGETGLPCTDAHPKRGARYVLYNPEKNTAYQLDGHTKPKAFAGRSVIVMGSLDQSGGTIYVDSMFGALPPKITKAKSVYIDCDACPRGMAAAWRAAFEELSDWGRFEIVPDPKAADLIFMFSANPYLGDYVTRDGPDKRPVAIDITYMNVVDPQTGQNLWGDSKQWGSLFVPKATKDLILELKSQLAMEESAGKT